MSSPSLRFPAALIAAAVAGPLFVLSYVAAELYLRIPQPVVVQDQEFVLFLAVMPSTFLVGGVIGLVPIFLGAAVMGALADRFEAMRSPFAWAAAGASCGVGLVLLFASWTDYSIAFALVATSTVCAVICRRQLL